MPQSLTGILIHIIFSTKDREPYIDNELRDPLIPYMKGILKGIGAAGIETGGTSDHMHLLVRVPPVLAVSELLRLLKSNSSLWVHREFPSRSAFAWQHGYGAFSVSQSNAPAVIEYIQNQERHHHRLTFQEEFISFLHRHEIEYDEKYVWG